MDADKALADGLTREIKAARDAALGRDPRSTEWTDRDVARRMTEAGHPMAHPAVIRARQGQRSITVAEWLTFAFVLSVPPLQLIAAGLGPESLRLANRDRSTDDVREWIHGARPFDDVPNIGVYLATSGQLASPDASHFAATLRSLADQFDTSGDDGKRSEIAVYAAGAALDFIRAREVERSSRARAVANRSTKGRKGKS